MVVEELLTVDIDLVVERSTLGFYDYIIVGSGFGGGILAEQLVQERKRVLLIEKGGPRFSTHILNTPRPDSYRGKDDSPEGNETIYASTKQTIKTAVDSEPYVGGPLYCLGGRSNVWGLWVPRGYTPTLQLHFPSAIVTYLTTKDEGYDKAFNLLTNDSQKTAIYPSGYMAESEITGAKTKLTEAIEEYLVDGGNVGIGPVASQFHSSAPYRFPQGAYSTTVPIINRIYARDRFLTVLMNTEVLRFNPPDLEKVISVTHLTLRSTITRQIHRIEIPQKTKVILSAGTLGTSQIALNSGLQLRNPLVGKGLIDHEVWALRFAMQKTQDAADPLLLQCMINICNTTALLTVTTNANYLLSSGGSGAPLPISQYLGRDGTLLRPLDQGYSNSKPNNDFRIIEKDFDTMQILLEYSAELDNQNEVVDIPELEPVIRVRRRHDTHTDEDSQIAMQDLATIIRNAFRPNFRDGPWVPPHLDPPNVTTMELPPGLVPMPPKDQNTKAPRLQLLGFGVFAHEVGTMRMPNPTKPSEKHVVDENLKVDGYDNLYACDLSVFPVSLQANPTLTLTAISMRLAEHLNPPRRKLPIQTPSPFST